MMEHRNFNMPSLLQLAPTTLKTRAQESRRGKCAECKSARDVRIMFERTVTLKAYAPSSSSLPSPQQHVSLSGILRSCALRFLRCSTCPVINEATSRYQMQWLPVCMVLVRNCSCAHSETMLIATLLGNKAFTHLPAHLRLTRP